MKNIPLEIVIPVFNEGEKILKLMDLFQKNIKTEFRVLFCYDLENDNLFNYKNELTKFDFEILFVKNPKKGPLYAIKEGFIYGICDMSRHVKFRAHATCCDM